MLSCSNPPGPKVLDAGRHGGVTVAYVDEPSTRVLTRGPALTRELDRLVPRADVVHVHGVWRSFGRAAAAAARSRGIPCVVRPAGSLGTVCRSHKAVLKVPYWRLLEKPMLDRVAAVHCCSEKERDEMGPLCIRAPRVVVPMPVDDGLLRVPPDFAALARLGAAVSGDGPLVLFVGRIHWIKRLDVLVEAFAGLADRHPRAALVLAGPGEDAVHVRRIRALADAAGLRDRVLLPGAVEGGLKAALYRRATVFAQPSSHENFGQSVAEALMFGVPAVVSDGVALGREIEAWGAGARCAGDPSAFRAALDAILGNAGCRAALGRRALEMAAQFRPAPVCEGLDRLYEAARTRSAPAASGTAPSSCIPESVA